MKKLEDASVDIVFADPPYNISKKNGLGWAFSKHVTMQEQWDQFTDSDFEDFTKKWIVECMRVLKPNGNFFVCGTYHNLYKTGYIMQHLGLKVINSIIWFKPNAQPNITCRMFTESTEQLIWACNGNKNWTFNYDIAKKIGNGKQLRNMWEIPLTPPSEKTLGIHPTQKPTELLRRIVLTCSNKGDLILDPFLGTGTTSLVAMMNNRNSIGIEKDKKYLEIVKKRLGQRPLSDAKVEFIK